MSAKITNTAPMATSPQAKNHLNESDRQAASLTATTRAELQAVWSGLRYESHATPSPAEMIAKTMAVLVLGRFPDCDATSRNYCGFVPALKCSAP
jgi:hypothetical protein